MVPVTQAWFLVATVVVALAGCKGDEKKDAAPAAAPAATPPATPAANPVATPAATPTPPTGGNLVTTPSGLKYEEISAALAMPVGTVKSRMFLAMARLKDVFDVEK